MTELHSGLCARGLTQSPKLAVGDGALGFWKALSKSYPVTFPLGLYHFFDEIVISTRVRFVPIAVAQYASPTALLHGSVAAGKVSAADRLRKRLK